MEKSGYLRKLSGEFSGNEAIAYSFRFADQELISANSLLGEKIELQFTGKISCVGCGRAIKKSLQQGYCFPCTQALAETDMCMVKPELCHYHLGTCRQPEWGQAHCFKPHSVYLANSSGLKVGITRQQPEKRWIDQGAHQGLVWATVADRKQAGLLEVHVKKLFNDKTNWRAMLKGIPDPLDFQEPLQQLASHLEQSGLDFTLVEPTITQLNYPVREYPQKVVSLNADKTPLLGGRLMGIKGQYLILDNGVINIRKYQGYEVSLKVK